MKVLHSGHRHDSSVIDGGEAAGAAAQGRIHV